MLYPVIAVVAPVSFGIPNKQLLCIVLHYY